MKRIVQLLFLNVFVATLFTFPKPAYACSCPLGEFSPAQALSQADAVFVGKAVLDTPSGGFIARMLIGGSKVGSKLFPGITSYQYYGHLYTFEVSESWKGIDRTHIIIQTGSGAGDCGYKFGLGGEYLVYAHGADDDGKYRTQSCSRTASIMSVEEDLQYLNTLPVLSLKPALNYALVGSLLCVATIAVAIVFWIFVRRKRRKSCSA